MNVYDFAKLYKVAGINNSTINPPEIPVGHVPMPSISTQVSNVDAIAPSIAPEHGPSELPNRESPFSRNLFNLGTSTGIGAGVGALATAIAARKKRRNQILSWILLGALGGGGLGAGGYYGYNAIKNRQKNTDESGASTN